jgi:hypothetical protein
MAFTNYDVEKNQGYVQDAGSDSAQFGGLHHHDLEKRHGQLQEPDGAVPGESFEYGDSWYAKTMRFVGKFGVEQRGIERVPEDERTDTGFKALLNGMTMVRFLES